MLLIRPEQILVFEHERLRAWLTAYLIRSYPVQSQNCDLSALVNSGLRQAAELGLTAPPDIRKLVHVCFLLGPDFESRPDLQWAADILRNDELPDPAARVFALEQAVLERLLDAGISS